MLRGVYKLVGDASTEESLCILMDKETRNLGFKVFKENMLKKPPKN